MVIVRLLLFPFAIIYGLLTGIRNRLYDTGQKRSFLFETMVISVGNLNTGGSGKTPMVEYIVRLLKEKHQLATLSRGYGRNTKGFRFVTADAVALSVGDEPLQLARKFDDIKVAVGEERAIAIPQILHEFPETEIILLDDAFQHRAVSPQLSILLTQHSLPFFKDFILPAGRLRESRNGAKRADIIVVTKCPLDLESKEQEEIATLIKQYAGVKPVFFSGISYDAPVPFIRGNAPQTNVILVSGIANAAPFEDYASQRFKVLTHFSFNDHHRYTNQDLIAIHNFYKEQEEPCMLLTTEKDMVKLASLAVEPPFQTMPWFYLSIKTVFLKNGSDFDKLVVQSVEDFQRTNDMTLDTDKINPKIH